MSCTVTLTGSLLANGGACSTGCGGAASTQAFQALGLACSGRAYSAVGVTPCPVPIATAGAVGAAFVALPMTQQLSAVELLSVKTTAPMMLRIGAAPAVLVGSGGSFPTGFSGGETLEFDVDGLSVPVTFTSGAQSAAQVAAEINQAAIAAGVSFLPASVTGGQLQLQGVATGSQGSVEVTTGNATIGLAVSEASGAGKDLQISGVALLQFDSAAPPSRIQISGSGQVEVLAAGS